MFVIFVLFKYLLFNEQNQNSPIQWNLSKQNFLGTNVYVWNRQVFALYRSNLQNISYFGALLKVQFMQDFSLYSVCFR
jgi:hypothetical protein